MGRARSARIAITSAAIVALGLAVATASSAQPAAPAQAPVQQAPVAQPAPAPAPSAEGAAPAPAAEVKPATPRKPASPKPVAEPAAPAAPPSEQAWVRGEMRTNFRANPTPTSTPMGVVKTGDQVGVFERRGDWARILVGDLIGWIPTSYLDSTPPPHEHLAMLEAQVADLQTKLDAATHEATDAKARIEQLSVTDSEREAAMRRMSEENRDLRAGERWPYLVTGAGILGIGLAVGLLLRGGSRRSSSRIRF
jgi:uncharacterized protein YgiM (DUF1202 family)